MSDGKVAYNPNKFGSLNVKMLANEFLVPLTLAHKEAVEGIKRGLPVEFEEKDEERFADLMDLDNWTPKEMLELASIMFAVAVSHAYEAQK